MNLGSYTVTVLGTSRLIIPGQGSHRRGGRQTPRTGRTQVRRSLEQLDERMEMANERLLQQLQTAGPAAAHGGWTCYPPR